MSMTDLYAMSDDRTDARWTGGAPALPKQYRLAWRWTSSGTTGHGPWMLREDVVEAWAESLNERHAGNVEHWIERLPGAE